jgi:enterobacterial common antigen flippase
MAAVPDRLVPPTLRRGPGEALAQEMRGKLAGAGGAPLALLRGLLRSDRGGSVVVQTVATQVIAVGLTMVSGVVTARLLGPEGRGVFAAVTLWPQFFVAVTFLGMPSAMIYHIRKSRDQAGTIFSASLLVAALYTVLAVAAGFLLVPATMRNYPAEALTLSYVAILATGGYLFLVLLRQLFVALGLVAAFNVSVCLAPLVYLLGLLATHATGTLTVASSTAWLIGSVAVTATWMCWHVRTVCRPRATAFTAWLRALLAYSTRSAAGDLMIGLAIYSDRLILVFMVSPSELGFYAVAYSLSRTILTLEIAFNSVVFPKMIDRPRAQVKELHDHAFRFIGYTALAIMVVMVVIGPTVIAAFYGSSFRVSALILDVLVLEAGLICVSTVAARLFYALGLPGYASLAQVARFVATLVGLTFLVPAFGALGAAVAMLLGESTRLLVLLWGLPHRLGLPLPRLVPRRADISYLREQFRA